MVATPGTPCGRAGNWLAPTEAEWPGSLPVFRDSAGDKLRERAFSDDPAPQRLIVPRTSLQGLLEHSGFRATSTPLQRPSGSDVRLEVEGVRATRQRHRPAVMREIDALLRECNDANSLKRTPEWGAVLNDTSHLSRSSESWATNSAFPIASRTQEEAVALLVSMCESPSRIFLAAPSKGSTNSMTANMWGITGQAKAWPNHAKGGAQGFRMQVSNSAPTLCPDTSRLTAIVGRSGSRLHSRPGSGARGVGKANLKRMPANVSEGFKTVL